MPKLNSNAYRLLHDGAIALAHVEANGIRIDTAYLERTINEASTTITKVEASLKKDKIYKVWRRRFGGRVKLTAKEQLATVLDSMGIAEGVYHEPTAAMRKKGIKRGNIKTDKTIFKDVDHPFVREWQKLIAARDMRSRMYGLKREVVDGLFHPNFNLHLATTFRSSSGKDREDDTVSREFNFQNIPVREGDKAKLIRSAFIPRGSKYRIGELDYKILEVCIGACYHKDQSMMKYIHDSSTDMHRDAAMDLWMIPEDQVTKLIRFWSKGGFVFSQFYGDWYKHCAKILWKAMEEGDLKLEDGTLLRKHLAKKGIMELGKCDPERDAVKGTFEHHIQKCERKLWERFAGYAQWKKDWFRKYLDVGWFSTLTGFVIEGVYARNDVTNYPIQGSAFHCLLWSLIQLQKWLEKKRMKTKILGQIHDSLVIDFYIPEMEEFLVKARQVMTRDIREYWPWIIVPLQVEVEIAPKGGNWFQKEKV